MPTVYTNYMNILRRILYGFAVSLLPVTLFGFGLLWSLSQVVGSAPPVKSAIDKSGVYNVVVDDVLLQNQTSISGFPLSDAGIKSAIENAFPPSLLQQSSDHILDGTYAW